MYKCKSLAKLCTWHKNGVPSNGLIWNVPDFVARKHINENWPKFAIDACNIRLWLALDKVTHLETLVHAIQPSQ
jgi:hypothetical protein